MPPGPLGGHILIKNGRTDPKNPKMHFYRIFPYIIWGRRHGRSPLLLASQRYIKKELLPISISRGSLAMAHHGLILRQNEATGSRKVFRCLLGLGEAI